MAMGIMDTNGRESERNSEKLVIDREAWRIDSWGWQELTRLSKLELELKGF